jgi:1-acyl-sn-glycerol-3-phosphate acyltransferase
MATTTPNADVLPLHPSAPAHAGPRPPAFGRWFSRMMLKLLGWQAVGSMPTVPKALFVASPHTTLWDGPIMVFVAWTLGVRLSFITKQEALRFPFKTFVTYFGGIGVNRSKSNDMVTQVAESFAAADGMYLAVAPDGTRKKADHWRSGFYHMARKANVPLVLGFLDYKQKRGGILGEYTLTGDVKRDMDHLRAVYANVQGKYPAQHSAIRLLAEDEAAQAAPAAR